MRITEEENVKNFLNFIKENGALFTVFTTAGSFLLTTIFRLGAYSFYKGCYDYWNIPKEYISIDYEHILWDFLVAISISLIVLLLVYIHCVCFRMVRKNNVGVKKWIKSILILLVTPLIITMALVFYFVTKIAAYDFLCFVCNYPMIFVGYIISFSIMYFCLMFGVNSMLISDKMEVHNVELKDSEQKDEVHQDDEDKTNSESKQGGDNKSNNDDEKLDKQKEKSKDIRNIGISIALIASIMGFCVTILSLYDIGKISIGFVEEVNVVEVNEIEYVLVVQYEDKWIVKKCIYEENELVINAENYMLTDITEKDIKIIELKGKTIEECMVSDSVFSGYKNKNKIS